MAMAAGVSCLLLMGAVIDQLVSFDLVVVEKLAVSELVVNLL